ncbi:hypothetical protein [Halorussus ruber]|uniref:hypothetical protein n=1 Tax=Halorussus ruber TaxID=1126238 RepID=UPI001091BA4B|nr:hypothetical protein [Halorussus ruber]
MFAENTVAAVTRASSSAFSLPFRCGSEAVSPETAGSGGESAGESDETSGADESNESNREENVFTIKTITKGSETIMNIARTERPRGRDSSTVLGGAVTTALAVVFDAAENEPLHVTGESEEDRGEDELDADSRRESDAEEVSGR